MPAPMSAAQHLIDAHGHVLCMDEAGCLHAHPITPAILPRAVLFDAAQGVFHATFDATPLCLAAIGGDIALSVFPTTSPLRVEHTDAALRLVASGFMLSATPSGGLTFSPNRAAWEAFTPVSGAFLAWLAAICTQGAILHHDKRFVPPERITIANGRLSVDGHDAALSNQSVLQPERHWTALLHDNGCLTPLRAFRPLIVFCVFAQSNLLATLTLAVRAIEHFGKIAPHYLILTDLGAPAVETALTDLPPERLSVREQAIATAADFLLARYTMGEWAPIVDFGPILYLDLDMACNAPIDTLLHAIAASPGLACNTEGDRGDGHHVWFGRDLFVGDADLTMQDNAFINSGAIGIPHITLAADIFTQTRRVAHTLSLAHRNAFQALDQPCFGYAARRFGPVETQLLPRHVVNWPPNLFADIQRSGLVHFCGGVGEFPSKHALMEAYLRFLDLPERPMLPVGG